jgi:hypothetical protein
VTIAMIASALNGATSQLYTPSLLTGGRSGMLVVDGHRLVADIEYTATTRYDNVPYDADNYFSAYSAPWLAEIGMINYMSLYQYVGQRDDTFHYMDTQTSAIACRLGPQLQEVVELTTRLMLPMGDTVGMLLQESLAVIKDHIVVPESRYVMNISCGAAAADLISVIKMARDYNKPLHAYEVYLLVRTLSQVSYASEFHRVLQERRQSIAGASPAKPKVNKNNAVDQRRLAQMLANAGVKPAMVTKEGGDTKISEWGIGFSAIAALMKQAPHSGKQQRATTVRYSCGVSVEYTSFVEERPRRTKRRI